MEKVTLQTLKDIEMLSDTKGTYIFDLAKKLHIFRSGHTPTKLFPLKQENQTELLDKDHQMRARNPVKFMSEST